MMARPTAHRGHVLVVGSLNADLVMHAPHLPRQGETVLGATFEVVAGGKGANQAAAAARLGVPVSIIGCVGDDMFGHLLREALHAAGVQIEHLRVVAQTATGTAHVVVDAHGNNAIVVAAGANAALAPDDLADAEPVWADAAVLVLQLEIPIPTVTRAIRLAARRHIPVVLNAAPAQALEPHVLDGVDWLVVNEVEAEQLSGHGVGSPSDAIAAAAHFRRPRQRAIVTLGAAGAVLVRDSEPLHIPAPQVDVVDTTAAGDAFVGALAAQVRRGVSDDAALRYSVIAGSLACTRRGALPSLPDAAAVNRLQSILAGASTG
jgi:ribokinase